MFDRLVISCEHGGNKIPPGIRAAFAGQSRILASHRGYDLGAIEVARHLARYFAAPLLQANISRLVIDLNRSLHHPKVFSKFTKCLPEATRRVLIERHYQGHREAVEKTIAASVAKGQKVLHLAVHSFTPRLAGVVRDADLGLLYDPKRRLEVGFCKEWQQNLRELSPKIRVRRNYPYVGYSDGFTTYLRQQFPQEAYAGIELEINQKWARPTNKLRILTDVLVESLVRSGCS